VGRARRGAAAPTRAWPTRPRALPGRTLWAEFFPGVDRGADGELALLAADPGQGNRVGGAGRALAGAAALQWRSDGGLSGALPGAVLLELALWSEEGELVVARVAAVLLAVRAGRGRSAAGAPHRESALSWRFCVRAVVA
jgi:hypothetical protein